ncbi:hypothetical protein PVAP13_3KG070646 [Panicum virgatum]|uniref:Uncharacterized protein n=1 Tax=Panicum virgatum TaxID=38727 RepID=A0A8T0UL67_PANVG|nr:hypothetical protein PVAP13_3KG070646 [Panicum virgatum]
MRTRWDSGERWPWRPEEGRGERELLPAMHGGWRRVWGKQEPSLPMGARGGELTFLFMHEDPGETPVRGGLGRRRRGGASGSCCRLCMGAGGGVGRAGALVAHGGQRRGGRAGALHLGVAVPRCGTPVRGGHGNQRRGGASWSAPSRARRARMVHRRAAVGGRDGWRREGEGHCMLKEFFFETHAERIDLDFL